MAQPMTNGRDRNADCPCGSGLKVKQCHGDPVIRQAATRIAQHMTTLFIVQRCHEKGLADAEETKTAIDKLVASGRELLPECVDLVAAYAVQEGEIEDAKPVDKLAEKEQEGGGVLESLQEDTFLCDCGKRLPVGMECVKCKRSK